MDGGRFLWEMGKVSEQKTNFEHYILDMVILLYFFHDKEIQDCLAYLS